MVDARNLKVVAARYGRVDGGEAMNIKQLNLKHWQDPVIALLGAWLAISPWVLGLQANTAVLAGSVIVGLVLIAAAIAAMYAPHIWEHWVTALLGALTGISPWLLGYAENQTAVISAAIVGIAVLVLSMWVLARDIKPASWWHDGVAH
jgi:hypothetical protein